MESDIQSIQIFMIQQRVEILRKSKLKRKNNIFLSKPPFRIQFNFLLTCYKFRLIINLQKLT